jgi:hypothetical protein
VGGRHTRVSFDRSAGRGGFCARSPWAVHEFAQMVSEGLSN